MLFNGFVYLAKSDTGHYKIGRSKNPFGRIKHFDTIMPVKVEIVHFFPTDDPVMTERELHKTTEFCWGDRVAGEWFDIKNDQVFVDSFCKITHFLKGVTYYIVEDSAIRDGLNNAYNIHNCCLEHTNHVIEERDGYLAGGGIFYISIPCVTAQHTSAARSFRSALAMEQGIDDDW